MVIKTETCSFSEGRIYPGHGSRYIRRDGSAYVFINSKSKSLFLQRKKATKIVWTLGWRRMNKKLKVCGGRKYCIEDPDVVLTLLLPRQVEEVTRRRTRKSTKIQRAIVGVSVEDIRKKRNQKPEVRAAARAALKEAKERSKTKKTVTKVEHANKTSKGSNAPRAQKKSGNRGAI
ncbi:hypothetical protein PsorP6_005286 [Peronosclerospora sorghi]|uniref:Uncharacterized protein n=1 Tax=Peronosclerospora sorghi TaxID=230839 RepID=A0ACC0W6N7_9STRA|nr:hypothetical protein PsorP6_005286 [Peronosclerospora sorghi]